VYRPKYEAYGLDTSAQERLALLGDLVLGAGLNVTGVKTAEGIERTHFLDSLSLLVLPEFIRAKRIADVGSGAGFPALVLALASPAMDVVLVEAVRKKCRFAEEAAHLLGLPNLSSVCLRAEDHGRGKGRGAYDVVVSRAVGPLAVVAEYSLPLLTIGGTMVAMKGSLSIEERIQGERALAILGAGEVEVRQLHPFEEAENRWAFVARKIRPTPEEFPRRPGVPAKKPLGGSSSADGA
jgi:16S rRNA (guanine527-N7)-methyltransferase